MRSEYEKYCTDCGQKLLRPAEICPWCGVRQPGPYAGTGASKGKSRIATALLALFFGSLGAHRFYLGHVGLGILSIVFSWTFIPGVIGFVEFLIFILMSDEQFARKYGGA